MTDTDNRRQPREPHLDDRTAAERFEDSVRQHLGQPTPPRGPVWRDTRAARLKPGHTFQTADMSQPVVAGQVRRTPAGIEVAARTLGGMEVTIHLDYKTPLKIDDPVGDCITVNVTLFASIVCAWSSMAKDLRRTNGSGNAAQMIAVADALDDLWSDVILNRPEGENPTDLAADLATAPGRDLYATSNPF